MKVYSQPVLCATCARFAIYGDALDLSETERLRNAIRALPGSLELDSTASQTVESSRAPCKLCKTETHGPRYWFAVMVPDDYEECAFCSFDHDYNPDEAKAYHLEHDPNGDEYK